MKRIFAPPLLAVALLGSALPATIQAAGTHAPVHSPACSIDFIVGRAACYAPSQVAAAEAQAPFAIRPSPAIKQILGIHLSQVIVYRSNPSARTPSDVYYLYGALRSDYGRSPELPYSVMVDVSPGFANGKQQRYIHHACGARIEISPAALDHAYRPWGPWYVRASFAHSARQFAMAANVRQPRLTQLACAIRRLG